MRSRVGRAQIGAQVQDRRTVGAEILRGSLVGASRARIIGRGGCHVGGQMASHIGHKAQGGGGSSGRVLGRPGGQLYP